MSRLIDADTLWLDIIHAMDYCEDILEIIERQPTAEPQWIPCSERLPEDRQECLVCVNCKNGKYVIDIASYATNLFKVHKYDFWDEVGKSGWYYLNAEYGYCKVLNVIAWMPLPEPYRAKRRTDENNNE